MDEIEVTCQHGFHECAECEAEEVTADYKIPRDEYVYEYLMLTEDALFSD